MKSRILLSFLILFSACIMAQKPLYNQEQLLKLKDLATQLRNNQEERLNAAIDKAKAEGKALREVGENGELSEIMGLTPLGHYVYYITDNLDAARTVSTDKVWPGGGLGLNLTGGSVNFGEWDGGAVRLTHREFNGRVTQADAASSLSDHATHVAGTMMASGVTPTAKGMAYTADLDAYDWSFDDAEMASAASNGMLLSNHSYGTITGWRYNSGLARWEWWGDTTISTTEDYRFGFYDFSARAWDVIAKNAPYYLIVKSAGNDRGDFHNGAHFSISSSSTSSAPRDPDGGSNGYDCISTNGTAKNILTVGAVNAIPGGYSAPSNVVMSSFSGWGPTDDGRIKPDICANGVGVYSSLASHDSAYASYNGTSMAAPNTTGSLVLIQQHYNNLNASYMLAATLKGLIIHTADEAGSSEGPDYQFGWGLLNTASAVNHITNPNSRDEIYENTLNNAQTFDLVVTSDGLSPLVATICWTDEPGTSPAASLNPTTRMLINDLDLRIIQNSNSAVNLPYTLNPASPSSAAVKADNDRDNVEKVYIASPAAGTYTIRVTHKGALASAQDYSLITSGGISTPTPISCSQYVGSFPYADDLETFTNCSTTPATACNLPISSGWENSTSDSIDWTVHNGSTPTALTGPSTDFKPGTASGKYLYIESSGAGNPGKEAILTSPCFDLDLITAPEFSFAYHMSGSDVGSLSIDVNSGISWTNVWFRSGDQGNNWLKGSIDLSSYIGDTIQLRIRGVTGSGEISDIAIDDFQLKSNPFSCNLTIGSFPYVEDFESFTNCSTTPATACALPPSSGYINSSSDDVDWTTYNGATPSFSTGPTIDFNPGTTGGKYLYVEASASGGSPLMEAILVGPCFDLSTLNNSELSFAYHMYGADMGDLYVDVDTGSGWSNVWSTGGDLGDQWNIAQIDLSDYDGKTIQVRIRAITGTSYLSDIAIDNIRMGGPTPRIYCSSGASSPVDTYIEEVVFESINNNTNGICAVYSDFTTQYAHLKNDSTYQLSVTTGDCDGGAAYSHGLNVYIDWNNDGAFTGTGELVYTAGIATAQTHLVNVTVPSNAPLDSLRMRLVCSENLPIEACGLYSYGESEDYTVVIIPSGPPNDNCIDAIPLSCGNILQGTTVDATADPGATNCGTPITAPGVWYKVVGNGQNMRVSLCGTTPNFNTKLNVYSGVCGGLNCIIGNDDFCGIASEVSWNSANGSTYYVLVQGENAETGDFHIELISSPSAAITTNSALTFCEGGSVSLSADTLLAYQWWRNGSPQGGANNGTYNASISGNYSVIVTDSNQCSDTTTSPVIVTVNPLPNVTITPSGPTTFCDGGSVVLGSTAGFSYQWYKDGILISGATGNLYTANSSGNYNVVMEDGNTCMDSASSGTAVIENPLPAVSITTSSATTFCDGDSIQLTTSGGTFYQWYENGIAISGSNSAMINASNASNYNVVVTDVNNCSDSAATSVQITLNPLPVVTITSAGSTTLCQGDSVMLSTSGGGNYQWYENGSILSGSTTSSIFASVASNFNVVVTDANNCSDSAFSSTGITVNPLPVVNMTTTPSTQFCDGDSITISTTTPGIYQWYANGSSIAGASSSSIKVFNQGTYNLVVTDANNCSDSASNGISTTVFPLPVVNITTSGPTTFCDGDSVELNTSTSGTYQWLDGGNSISSAVNSSYKATSGGSYNVRVTDGNNCSNIATNAISVTVNPLPIVSITNLGNGVFCDKDSTILEANSGLNYQWFKGRVPQSGATNRQFAIYESGVYNVQGLDLNGCSDTSANPVTIQVLDLPVVTFSSVPDLCNTISSYVLKEGSPIGGVYFGSGVSNDSLFDPSIAGAGTHTLYYRFTDQTTGCENLDSVVATVVNCVGIAENGSKFSFIIYPNPANAFIRIEAAEAFELEKVELINIQGKRLKLTEFADDNNQLRYEVNTNGVAPGVYFLEITSDKGVGYHRIIIQR